ncbi:MAG: hypothetical protein ACI822_001280 [Gammaproteobacteria bacterium]|jgi:hypothetical protein
MKKPSSLLQHLGKVLVRFYLHEESQAIDKLVTGGGASESSATIKVLGQVIASSEYRLIANGGFQNR